jgi:hypothetical protein
MELFIKYSRGKTICNLGLEETVEALYQQACGSEPAVCLDDVLVEILPENGKRIADSMAKIYSRMNEISEDDYNFTVKLHYKKKMISAEVQTENSRWEKIGKKDYYIIDNCEIDQTISLGTILESMKKNPPLIREAVKKAGKSKKMLVKTGECIKELVKE